MPTEDEDGFQWNCKLTDHPFDDRNYNLFALLANVRNGTWGEEIEPISEPRGLPFDISKAVAKKAREWGEDGHSHSWLSLQELKKIDWSKTIKYEAYVSEEQKREYEEKGVKPRTYAAWSSSGVILKWQENYYNAFGKKFKDEIILSLEALEKYGDVRIVFWFDN